MIKKDLVWYVGYGSNINKGRFLSYIVGGRPEGSTKKYKGCRDTSIPIKDEPIILNHDFYFAKSSKVWNNGGVCFINIEENKNTRTYARMYLITRQQLEDIAKQETSDDNYLKINFEDAIINGSTVFKQKSWYGKLIFLGINRTYPIFTLTHENNIKDSTKPTNEYLRTIILGIKQIHTLTNSEIVKYFIQKRGIKDFYTIEELDKIVDTINNL